MLINRTIHAVRFCNYMFSLEYISYMLSYMYRSIYIRTYVSAEEFQLSGFRLKVSYYSLDYKLLVSLAFTVYIKTKIYV